MRPGSRPCRGSRSPTSATSTSAARGEAAEAVKKAGAKAPKAVGDFRRILDDKAVDALVVATCNHWHAPGGHPRLRGGQARLRREAVQPQPARGGTAGRGGPQARAGRADGQPAAELAEDHRGDRAGPRRRHRPGLLRPVRATATRGRRSAAASEPPVPTGLDYDLWQGPAPRRPYRDNYPALQLALVLALGQRRAGQQRHPHDRRLPLGPRRRLPDPRHLLGRPLPLRGRPGDARHPRRHLRVRRTARRSPGRA